MLFREKHAHAAVNTRPEWMLLKTDRYFACTVCQARKTGYRDLSLDCEVPVCSDECRNQMFKDYDSAQDAETVDVEE